MKPPLSPADVPRYVLLDCKKHFHFWQWDALMLVGLCTALRSLKVRGTGVKQSVCILSVHMYTHRQQTHTPVIATMSPLPFPLMLLTSFYTDTAFVSFRLTKKTPE